MKSTLKLATEAAEDAFNLSLGTATAAFHVPDSVISAAEKAFSAANGRGKIKVVGRGNNTHPIISVTVVKV